MIRVGIVGYGNLGRGVEAGLAHAPDMELVGVFTRRAPQTVDTQAPVYPLANILDYKDQIDVLILCGGSLSDIPDQGPMLAAHFNTVDSYDNHSKINEYYQQMDTIAKEAGTVCVISTGWDPGLFSLQRVIGEAVLPSGVTNTFWGPGVSQGHSDAIRRISGVKAAVQYTLPKEAAMDSVRKGEAGELTNAERHTRECFVVLEEGAHPEVVRQTIVTMPAYFEGYHTTVHFITMEELKANHSGIPHGGTVLRTGRTGSQDTLANYSFTLELGSNPEFTASVDIAYARACYRLAEEGAYGAKTVLDIPPKYLSASTEEELRKYKI